MTQTSLKRELENLITRRFSGEAIAKEFLDRLKEGNLTIDENPQSHFCTYFVAHDPNAKQIFIGHHKKSGLWLTNGGHIDRGETLRETLAREIDEEWGMDIAVLSVNEPEFLTITGIYNPEKQPCRRHFDIWHFIAVDKRAFMPDEAKSAEEFHENRWVSFADARKLTVADANHQKAIAFIEKSFSN